MLKKALTAIFIVIMAISAIDAQNFVYQPRNPAFGGSYMNYSWMLNSANAQNTIQQETQDYSYRGYERDPVAEFEQDLQRQIFSQLSDQIMQSYFGEDFVGEGGELEEGEYSFGNYDVNIYENQQGINIQIRDFRNGGETTVTVPYF